MGCCNLRSLLLAAIFLSSCISWTASRHHYAHNASYHRSRHRRQGAGLYLTSSFVIPDGVGAGSWGDWGPVSTCSRTCGGGVAHQKRICLELGSDGKPTCIGGNTKYFSCNTQDCPPGSADFRSEQCSSHDTKPFKGTFYEWIPYTRGLNPCELNCKPKGDRFYFRFEQKVIDGTRCNDESFDVCVDGICQAVGCDMMLGSNSKEDKCRVCRGNGNNCDTIQGLIDSQDYTQGYNDIILIPENASNIYIREIRESNNYLALRNQNNTYYLNGDFKIDFPQRIHVAGMIWHYQRNELGFSAPDELRCQGPTTEPLYLSLLLQDKNVGIEYEYSIPQNVANRVKQKYNWAHDNFTECSATCGGGHQVRNVSCRTDDDLEVVDDELCDRSLRPAVNQSCNTEACAPEWKTGVWGECSKRCGKGGIQSRNVYCEKIITNGVTFRFPSIVSDKECMALLGAQPDAYQTCNENSPCPRWFIGPWKPCNKLCGEGKQIRQVICHQKNQGKVEILQDEECEETKPPAEQACTLKICEGVDWVVTDWVGCDTCLSTVRTRTAACATDELKVVNDKFCSHHPTPVLKLECDKDKLPACQTQWYSSQWGNCSVDCGKGIRSREVFCGKFDGKSVLKVDDAECDLTERYNDTKPCEVPPEDCPAKWFAGPWTKCSKECDGGTQRRMVTCLNGNQESKDCDVSEILDPTRTCNRHPCNADQIIPKDPTSKPIMDDYDEYCDEDEYPEMGAEEFLTSTSLENESSSDFSGYTDSSSPTELESELTTSDSIETDSGYTEGSGPTELESEFSTSDSSETGSGVTSSEDMSTKDDYYDSTTTSESSETTYSDTEETHSSTEDSSDVTKNTGDTSSTEFAGKSTKAKKPGKGDETTKYLYTASTKPSTINSGLISTAITEPENSTTETPTTSPDLNETTSSQSTVTTPSEVTEKTPDSTETEKSETTVFETTEANRTVSTETSDTSSMDTATTETGITAEAGITNSGSTDATETTTAPSDTSEISTASDNSTSSETTSPDTTESTIAAKTSETSSTETSESPESSLSTISETISSDILKTTTSVPSETTTPSGTTSSDKSETSTPSETTSFNTPETTKLSETSSSELSETSTASETLSPVTSEPSSSENSSNGTSQTTSLDTSEITTPSETASPDTSETSSLDTSETTMSSETLSTDTSETSSIDTSETSTPSETSSTGTFETTTLSETSTSDLSKTTSSETSTSVKSDKSETTTPSEISLPDISGTTTSSETSLSDIFKTTLPSETSTSGASETTTPSEISSPNTSETSTPLETSTTVTYETTSSESAETTTPSETSTTSASETTTLSEISSSKLSETTTPFETSTTSASETTTLSEISSSKLSETTTPSESSLSELSETTAISETSPPSTSESITSFETSSSGIPNTTSPEILKTTLKEIETTKLSEKIDTTTLSDLSETITPSETSIPSETSETTQVEASTTTISGTVESSTLINTSDTSDITSSTVTSTLFGKTESTETNTESDTTTSASTESSIKDTDITENGTTVDISTTETTLTTESITTERTSSTSSETISLESSRTTEALGGSAATESSSFSETEEPIQSRTTSSWSWSSTINEFSTTKKHCKKRTGCKNSEFGCCPDKKTPATGPFDKGCSHAATCKDTDFGCCPDGVSPASGPNNDGCPTTDCNETLFGCCLSDNKTAAEDNDQKGCPPPCVTSKYGCCEDNETEAQSPNGCKPDTTSTEIPSSSTEISSSSIEISSSTEISSTISSTELSSTANSESTTSSDSSSISSGTSESSSVEISSSTVSTESVSTTIAPEGCAIYEFGCCSDNETRALGPNEEGCPCATTINGCCPDGITPAGINMDGCKLCNTSAHGCCPDGVNPAHGPDSEGCCLLSAYGCCPDNYKPAEGPHLEGCGCQHAKYGCCPDNETIARGVNNEGCGCKFSQFGCCPDGLTAAAGENFQGCTCESYQFGCCSDGVTSALGPNQQGCFCQESKYGCCDDEETPAQGPNKLGCDCSNSKYGCCPDGQTSATGIKFQGCTDIPENKQAACSLPSDLGPCSKYVVYWHFNTTYGDCYRFWYGGCEGNDNKFATQEECKAVCVNPSPKDACKLPKNRGTGEDNYLRWYYDSTREQCKTFEYGGWNGNANNFETKERCQEQCEPPRTDDQCKVAIDPGTCSGNFGRWGFNPETRDCEQFIWGGCEGNNNRFSSREACLHRCNPPGSAQPECTELQDVGNCTNKIATWSFSQSENRCVPFYYTGCGGNENNFDTEELCSVNCPSVHVQDDCHLPASIGDCADYKLKWFYDSLLKRCRQFYYGGCGGNNNNFETEDECENKCSGKTTTTSTTLTTPSTTLEPFREEFCFMEKDFGPCNDVQPRWAYDTSLGKCAQFEYGGCNGNRNNFLSEVDCNDHCRPTQDICQLPMRIGSCSESQMKWFYNASSDRCSQFTYSGCDGNDNKFDTMEDCQQRCRSGYPTESEVPPPCAISDTLEECFEPGVVWYLNTERRECLPYRNVDSGQHCRVSSVFSSRTDCEETCAEFPGLVVHSELDVPQSPTPNHEETEPEVSSEEGGKASLKCIFHSNPPPTITWRRGQITIDGDRDRYRLLSDGTLEIVALVRSDAGVYICVADNGLGIAEQEINLVIKDSNVCQQVQERGPCSEYVLKWSYDESRDMCSQFWYGGCDGNGNNFKTQEDCEGRCKKQSVPTTTTSTTTTSTTTTTTTTIPPIKEPEGDKECRTPKSLEPCGRNISTFYYDSRSGLCTAGNFGGCGYINSYRSEEECERRCGRYQGLEVCRYPLDPGPCRFPVNKFYWDTISGTCKIYTYGGCEGSPNRFSSIEECEEACKPVGPDNNVLPDCSQYTLECAALRCEFGVQRVRTADECERCSCVQVDYNCTILERQCEDLKCSYGVKKTVGDDGCTRCSCLNHPCAGQYCREGEKCVATPYRDSVVEELRYSAECRIVDKPGSCPTTDPSLGRKCRRECNDDADCRGVGKCCKTGCSELCLSPVYTTTTLLTTLAPNIPQSPTANREETEPEVSAEEGGKASLKCVFHSNPPPLITWRRGQVTIDGDRDRYRLLSDGTLEIVALVRSDAGVYICVADNGLGIAEQEINLFIKDPVESEAKIAGEAVSVLEAEVGKPIMLQCLAYGYPLPSVAWYKGLGGPMVPYLSKQYEARGNSLLIREVNAETLGDYVCDAFNGIGDSASWLVTLRARSPENNFIEQELVEPATARTTRRPPPRAPDLTTTPMSHQFEVEPNVEKVSTRVRADRTTVPAGSELIVQCEARGSPTPFVSWTKDGDRLSAYGDQRFKLTDSLLRLSNARQEDSGVYGCFARNQFSEHESTIAITVRDVYIPVTCTDNPLFANCVLIVRSKFCKHRYYSQFCCKSCAEAGQLGPQELQQQADQPLRI